MSLARAIRPVGPVFAMTILPRTPPRRTRRTPRGRVWAQRGVAVLVLAGYLSAVSTSPAGYGWWLAAHLASAHADAAAEAGPDDHGEGQNGDDHERAHDHHAETPAETTEEPPTHGHHGTPDHHHPDHAARPAPTHPHSGTDEDEAHDTSADETTAPHSHDGRLHVHDEPPPRPVLLTVALDKHCVFSGPVVPAPLPARDLDSVSPGAAAAFVSLSVETPPPQPLA